MHETVEVPLVDLQLDPGNARLGEEQPSQQAIYSALARQQGKRLLVLAADIVANGLDPTALPAVVASGDRHKKRYRVVEGNRRVLALKALETPSIISSELNNADQRKLHDLAAKFSASPIDVVECVLFDREDEIVHWIQMRHTGSNDGAGLVEWDANEQDRFLARHKVKGGARQPAGQIIDFVAKVDGDNSPNQGIITNVKRLISTRAIRDAVGIDIVGDQVVSHYPVEEVAKGLRKIVNDLKSGAIKVNNIYYDQDRQDYLSTFKRTELPAKSKALKQPVSLTGLGAGRTTPVKTPPRRQPKPVAAPRTSVIPGTCAINVAQPRINDIYNELLSLNVDQYPNACSVLLRVFLELSVDHEIDRSSLMTEAQRRSSNLSKRLKAVADSLHKKSRIPDQLRKAVHKIADSQHVIAASTTTFNQYVHNQYVHPKPSELRTAWDELQPFMEALWP